MYKAGLLLIEVDCKQYADNLLNTKNFHDIPVDITEHRTLNSSKGVISTAVLDDMSNEEIRDELSDQGVKEVFRFMTKKNGNKIGTRTMILTFDTPKRPDFIYTGYMRLKVKDYIPNPRRCFKCQKFGHTVKFCKNDAICEKCGQSGHESGDCSNPIQCINCGEAHPASSRDCYQWIIQKEILKCKVENDISYPEAEKRTIGKKQSVAERAQTYSSALAKPAGKRYEIGIQTDLTWPDFMDSPVPLSECIIDNDKSVQSQTNENMEIENATLKRGREESLSSHDDDDNDLITIPRYKSKRTNRNEKVSSEETEAPGEGVTPKESEAPREPGASTHSGGTSREGGEEEKDSEWREVVSARSHDRSRPPSPRVGDRGASKGVSRSSAHPSSVSPEGEYDSSSGPGKGQKSSVLTRSYSSNYRNPKPYDKNSKANNNTKQNIVKIRYFEK